MGGHSRDRSGRAGRKVRSSARHSSSSSTAAAASDRSSHAATQSVPDSSVYPDPDSDQTAAAADAAADSFYRESDCGYCTEEQLEDLLLKNLDFAYHEALGKLGSLGYSTDVALHGVLCGGHCCGPADVVTNIVTNTVDYLNNTTAMPGSGSSSSSSGATGGGGFAGFSDLRALEEYSLAGMVCLVKQHRRGISRGDAMWCLLMGDLHVGRACQIELPPPNCCSPAALSYPPAAEAAAAVAAGGLRYDPATSGFSPFTRMKTVGPGSGAKGGTYGSEDFIDGLMKELELVELEDKSTDSDAQTERIYELFRQAREMEEQVKERREWAQQKALQAAQRLSRDMAELRALRMEKDRRERMKKAGTPAVSLDEDTLKRLEEGFKKASLQVDKANAEVQRLEAENAEIRAEMQAAKLSAAESTRTQQEAARREKRVRKKSQTRDRQRQQLLDEIEEARQMKVQLQKEIDDTCKATKEAEIQLKEERKVKEEAAAQLEELSKATEATKATFRRRIDSLRQKIELDAQRYRDDIRRLQEEHARLLSQNSRSVISSPIANSLTPSSEGTNRNGRTEQQERRAIGRRWQCMACAKEEVSVLLLPCAHQVLCVACNESHVSMGKVRCPCCNAKIEERVRVYGVST